jgi:hypothetical protein
MYEKLLKISKYSTERLIDSLKTVMPQIEEYFAPFEIINPNMSDDEKISILLEHFVFTVRNFAKGEIQKMIDSDRYDINRLKKIKSKYENRSAGYMKYLNDYEKYLQTEPQKIIKKLSKVYKMLPD